jgi:hypothetical protein
VVLMVAALERLDLRCAFWAARWMPSKVGIALAAGSNSLRRTVTSGWSCEKKNTLQYF